MKEIRQVNVKKFHANFFKEVKNLPLIVTKYGKPYLQILEVVPIDGRIQSSKNE
jgi:hypothetical protein